MCSEQPLTSVLGELLNHWQQFQRLQRAIAVLQVETIQDSERSNFYNFTLSKKWFDSIRFKPSIARFAICHQCRTACIYTCQQLFDFGCLRSFLIQLGEKVQTRLLKGVAGELFYKGLRQSLRLNQTRSTQGVILYRAVRGGTSPKLHSGYRSPQPRGETPSLWKEWQNFPNHFRALTLAEAGFYMLSFHVQTCTSQLCG